jgi:TRAP-type C4-dicarboxylate transport system permease large subunit
MARQPLSLVSRGAFPFVILMCIMIVILTIWPGLALWLPAKMM